jgi:hypothetical protein
MIRGDEHLSALPQLNIYPDVCFYWLPDCPKEDFPATSCLIIPLTFSGGTDRMAWIPAIAGRSLGAILAALSLYESQHFHGGFKWNRGVPWLSIRRRSNVS